MCIWKRGGMLFFSPWWGGVMQFYHLGVGGGSTLFLLLRGAVCHPTPLRWNLWTVPNVVFCRFSKNPEVPLSAYVPQIPWRAMIGRFCFYVRARFGWTASRLCFLFFTYHIRYYYKGSLRVDLGTWNMPQMKFGIWNMSMKKGTRDTVLIWNREYGTTKITQFWNMGRGKKINMKLGTWN